MDSKELFNAIKNGQIKITLDKNKKQDEFLNNLSNIKILKETPNKKGWLIILLDFTILEKKLLIFLKIIEKWSLMQPTNQNKIKLREKDLKY